MGYIALPVCPGGIAGEFTMPVSYFVTQASDFHLKGVRGQEGMISSAMARIDLTRATTGGWE
jgi:hypothetical protein